MSTIIITGSTGLVGSESVDFFCKKGFDVIGIDNNLRQFFFGKDGSTIWVKRKLQNAKDLTGTSVRSGKELITVRESQLPGLKFPSTGAKQVYDPTEGSKTRRKKIKNECCIYWYKTTL